MSMNKFEFKSVCIKYCDLSSKNDLQMQLISSMLLKLDDVLEIKELKALGEIIDDYLNQKIVMDHYFWKRGLQLSNLSKEEVDLQLLILNKS